MEIESSFSKKLGQLRTNMIDHALIEAKIRLFPFLMAKEHTVDIIKKINTLKDAIVDFNETEKKSN